MASLQLLRRPHAVDEGDEHVAGGGEAAVRHEEHLHEVLLEGVGAGQLLEELLQRGSCNLGGREGGRGEGEGGREGGGN